MSNSVNKSSEDSLSFHLETMEPRILFSADSPFAVLDVAPLIQSEVSIVDVAANDAQQTNSASDIATKEIIIK